MTNIIEWAGGSVIGAAHRHAGRNNQDSFAFAANENVAVAVVCDGCGSGAHSEVGAQLGAATVCHQLCNLFPRWVVHHQMRGLSSVVGCEASTIGCVELAVLDLIKHNLQHLVWSLRDVHTAQIINDFFLFTIIGVIVTPHTTAFFACGDGYYFVNGLGFKLGPFPGNAPPYLAYRLAKSSLQQTDPNLLHLRVVHQMPTAQVNTLAIGCDGLDDLLDAEVRPLDVALPSDWAAPPTIGVHNGDIDQFWDEDKYFANPALLGRRLAQMNRAEVTPDWDTRTLRRSRGRFEDDTTLVVGRRPAAAQQPQPTKESDHVEPQTEATDQPAAA